jgi:hypothetical protein
VYGCRRRDVLYSMTRGNASRRRHSRNVSTSLTAAALPLATMKLLHTILVDWNAITLPFVTCICAKACHLCKANAVECLQSCSAGRGLQGPCHVVGGSCLHLGHQDSFLQGIVEVLSLCMLLALLTIHVGEFVVLLVQTSGVDGESWWVRQNHGS